MQSIRTNYEFSESSQYSLTVGELALRWRCHRNTIYKMLRDGQLQSFRVRRNHLVTGEEVHRVESQEIGVAV